MGLSHDEAVLVALSTILFLSAIAVVAVFGASTLTPPVYLVLSSILLLAVTLFYTEPPVSVRRAFGLLSYIAVFILVASIAALLVVVIGGG